MRKKLLFPCVVCAAAVVIVLLVVGLFYKGADGVTFFQKQNINQYLSQVPFEVDNNIGYLHPPIAVAPGTDSLEKNTFLGSKAQVNYATGYISANVAVNGNGKVVLTDSYDGITGKSVDFFRVLSYMNEQEQSDTVTVFNLSEYTSVQNLAAFISANELERRSVISGVDENAIKYIKSVFPRNKVLCDYSSANDRSLAEIKADGADGILCAGKDFSASLLKKAKKNNLLVWVNCEENVYATVIALQLNVDGIVTTMPDFAVNLVNNWNTDYFNSYWKK